MEKMSTNVSISEEAAIANETNEMAKKVKVSKQAALKNGNGNGHAKNTPAAAKNARYKDENDPEARAERDERDILGRLNNGVDGFGDDVQIPDEIERQKARDILDEIRRRAGNRALTREELEYLNRLLERF